MASAYLDDRSVVRVAGEDARSFLQGLVTCDMAKVGPAAGFGALLSPQGKILFDFLVVQGEDGFLFDIAGAQASAFVKRLGMYRLRAKITIEERFELGIVALWDGATAEGLVFDDPRHPGLGRRCLLARASADASADAAAYHQHRILCGVPEGGRDYPFGEIFPHDADLDLLHGVDFRKGCYVGQEVVSRVEHRGSARKRIVPVALRGHAAAGSTIVAGDLAIGTMGSSAGARGLALIRLDKAEEAIARGVPLTADASVIELLPDHMP